MRACVRTCVRARVHGTRPYVPTWRPFHSSGETCFAEKPLITKDAQKTLRTLIAEALTPEKFVCCESWGVESEREGEGEKG